MRLSFAIPAVLALALVPSTARAIEVMCNNEAGVMCTLDGAAGTYDCTCDGAPVGGTTGSSENPWADLDEAALMDACMDLLPADCSIGETGGSGGDEAEGTGPVSSTTPDTNGTDPSGPNSDTQESASAGDSSGGESDDDDDDDKGCTIGGHAGAPALALLVLFAGRRRVRSAAR